MSEKKTLFLQYVLLPGCFPQLHVGPRHGCRMLVLSFAPALNTFSWNMHHNSLFNVRSSSSSKLSLLLEPLFFCL